MSWIWAAVFVVVVGGFGTEWEALAHLLENRGVGEEGVGLLAFTAGYTFPLSLGVSVIALAILWGVVDEMNGFIASVLAALILAVAGWLAGQLGLGLLPEYDASTGPLLWFVIKAYFNSYGWPLTRIVQQHPAPAAS